jgi:putative transcription antitermination factor YqgF
MSLYLGIDYGLSHIGLATSEHTLATPLPPLANNGQLVPKLKQIIQREGITHIICGIPDGVLAKPIKTFAAKLAAMTNLSVILWPETLSTQEAIQKLHQVHAARSKRRNEHAYAACLILEDYLELTAKS